MSGPYHERAVCKCGFTEQCAFGDLAHLTHHGRFINVCPACGLHKNEMTVRVLRWHQGTWRDLQGEPYNGVEPSPPQPSSRRKPFASLGVVCLLVLLVIAWIAA
jgi:hypothetical protein